MIFKLTMLFDKEQCKYQQQIYEPLWLNLPSVCLELILDNQFLQDLIKSETYFWEVNDTVCRNDTRKYSPLIGSFTGIISELIHINSLHPSEKSVFEMEKIVPENKFYLPGRLSEEMQYKLNNQVKNNQNAYFVAPNILFPGLSFCFANLTHALLVL